MLSTVCAQCEVLPGRGYPSGVGAAGEGGGEGGLRQDHPGSGPTPAPSHRQAFTNSLPDLPSVSAGGNACLYSWEYRNCKVHQQSAIDWTPPLPSISALIKKKIKFSSCIRKFTMEQLQSHI
jgi:hypothetical protein